MIIEFKISLKIVIQNELTESLSKTMKSFTGENHKIILWWNIGTVTITISWDDHSEIDKTMYWYIQQYKKEYPDRELTIVWVTVLE